MPPREAAVFGPRKLVDADVAGLNQVFADAFTDRYRRDGMVGVRVPRLNPAVWRYALRGSGDGAMVWTDHDEKIAAFNVAHTSGTEGWMGPLAVRTDLQALGVGRAIVQSAVDWLKERDVKTIGLETMPRTVDNIGFYSHLGFVPGHLTVTMVGDARRGDSETSVQLLSEMGADQRESLITRCVQALDRVAAGYDYAAEFRLTVELSLGDAAVIITDGEVVGFALWHSASLVEGRPADEIRVLKLFATSHAVFADLIVHIERAALNQGLARVSVRCQSGYESAFVHFVDRGYRVRWTDLRMTLEGYPAVSPANGAVLFSNWEI